MEQTEAGRQERPVERVVGRLRGLLYRAVMRIAHRFHWHYAPPIYPEGDTHLWCKWCGFRQTIRRRDDKNMLTPNTWNQPPRKRSAGLIS